MNGYRQSSRFRREKKTKGEQSPSPCVSVMNPEPVTFLQPGFDVCLPGVNGLVCFTTHVADVGAELPGPGEIDPRCHRQLLKSSPLLSQSNGLWVFLRGQHK